MVTKCLQHKQGWGAITTAEHTCTRTHSPRAASGSCSEWHRKTPPQLVGTESVCPVTVQQTEADTVGGEHGCSSYLDLLQQLKQGFYFILGVCCKDSKDGVKYRARRHVEQHTPTHIYRLRRCSTPDRFVRPRHQSHTERVAHSWPWLSHPRQ